MDRWTDKGHFYNPPSALWQEINKQTTKQTTTVVIGSLRVKKNEKKIRVSSATYFVWHFMG